MHASRAWRCMRCECTHSHHCSQDQATFEPTSPCRTGEESPRTQRAGIPGVLAGEGCSGCFHEERSLKNRERSKLASLPCFIKYSNSSTNEACGAIRSHWQFLRVSEAPWGGWEGKDQLWCVGPELCWWHKHFRKAKFTYFWYVTLLIS